MSAQQTCPSCKTLKPATDFTGPHPTLPNSWKTYKTCASCRTVRASTAAKRKSNASTISVPPGQCVSLVLSPLRSSPSIQSPPPVLLLPSPSRSVPSVLSPPRPVSSLVLSPPRSGSSVQSSSPSCPIDCSTLKPSASPMSSFVGSFMLDNATALANQRALTEHITRRKIVTLTTEHDAEFISTAIPPTKNCNYDIKRITDSLFSAAVHPLNFHLRCHLHHNSTASTCDFCYQFNHIEGFCCEHSIALQQAFTSSSNISPIGTYSASDFHDEQELSRFKLFSAISTESLSQINNLISISAQRNEPAVVHVTERSFSVIVENVQYWSKEGRVFVKQWGDRWRCNCGGFSRCAHVMLVIYALHIRDPKGLLLSCPEGLLSKFVLSRPSQSHLSVFNHPGVLAIWISRKSIAPAKGTINETSLSRFHDGLLAALLSQPLIPLDISTSIKKMWTDIRTHQQHSPKCHHYDAPCSSCGAKWNSTSDFWPCGHPVVTGETIAYSDASLFDTNSPPTQITTFLRICQTCGTVSRPTTLQSGIFSYDERHVFTVPFLLHIRHSINNGIALHKAVLILVQSLEATFDNIHISPSTINNIKSAYLAFEALSNHDEHSTCLLCKQDPSHLIFDGNAKLVFKLSGTSTPAYTLFDIIHISVSFLTLYLIRLEITG